MKKILLIATLAFTLASCDKDKFETVPKVEITSFGPSEVVKGNLIKLFATVTDKEGDVQDSVVVARKIFNGNTLLTVDTVRSNLEALNVPSRQTIEIEITYLYGELRPELAPIQNGVNVDRNYALGIYVKDKAGNRSQYVESDKIVLKKI